MIPFKVKISRFKKQSILLPTSWGEISLNQLYKIQENITPEELFKVLTGFDKAIDITPFLPYMDWILKAIDLEDFSEYFFEPFEQFNIFECAYKKRVQLEFVLKNPNLMKVIADVCAIYSERDKDYYLKAPVSHSVGFALKIIEQFNQLVEKENNLLNRPSTHEEILAGIDAFKELSHFNTIDMIAKEYGYTHEAVEDLEYNVVFLILRRKQIIANFDKRHREALKSNK